LFSFEKYDFLFFDFDGVIKESVEVKGSAFEELFSSFGRDLAARVRQHHELNGGVSRYDKIPLYLELAGIEPAPAMIEEYLARFSVLAKQYVIKSEWVPGAYQFISEAAPSGNLFLLSATPHREIHEIVKEVGLQGCFRKIVGSPKNKGQAIQEIIEEYSVDNRKAVMIGDSAGDCQAAMDNDISFVLRRTQLNIRLQEELNCYMIDDFYDDEFMVTNEQLCLQ